MSLSVEGFDELFNTLDSLGNVGKKVGVKAVRGATKTALKSLKRYAPKKSGKGGEALKVISVKSYKSGSVWGKAGIDKTNWEETKHLWFQNYGYNVGKAHVTKHVGWVERAFQECKKDAQKEMIDIISTEIDNSLR